MKQYLVINQPEASYPHVEYITEKVLLERINENYYGEDVKYLDTMPNCYDGCFDKQGVMIFEAKLIVPKAKQVVTEYTL